MTPGAFSGRVQARQALLEALQAALQEQARVIQVWDTRLQDWPWSDPALLQALPLWARPGRVLQLLTLNYEELAREHPRFVRWRRDYAHCVRAQALDEGYGLQGAPEALLLAQLPESRLTVRLLDRRVWRGEVSRETHEHRRAAEWFDAAAQRSHESFAPTTLGL